MSVTFYLNPSLPLGPSPQLCPQAPPTHVEKKLKKVVVRKALHDKDASNKGHKRLVVHKSPIVRGWHSFLTSCIACCTHFKIIVNNPHPTPLLPIRTVWLFSILFPLTLPSPTSDSLVSVLPSNCTYFSEKKLFKCLGRVFLNKTQSSFNQKEKEPY